MILVLVLSVTASAAGPRAQTLIDTVYLTGDSSAVVPMAVPFTQDGVTQLMAGLLSSWQAQGYYYATARPGRVRRTSGGTRLSVRLDKGPLVTLGRQRFTGLTRSSRSGIERYLPLGKGDTVTSRLLERAASAADGIEHVQFVPPVRLVPREGYTIVDLEYAFREQPPATITAGGGYLPDDATGLVWHLDLAFNNLFGAGRRVGLLSERRERGRRRLAVSYRQPLFWLGIGQLALDLQTRDYRDSFYEFAAEGQYSVRLLRHLSSGIALGWRSVEPATEQPSYVAYSIEYTIDGQTLDDRFNPSRGVVFESAMAYAHRRYRQRVAQGESPLTALDETRTAVRLGGYETIVGGLVGHLKLRYEGLETNEPLPPLPELLLVGGPGTLRGYRNEQFSVIRTAIVTVEPRWRFGAGYAFAFYDGAYLNSRVVDQVRSVRIEEEFRDGYGIGLALREAGRSLKLSLGWNRDVAFDQPRLSVELAAGI